MVHYRPIKSGFKYKVIGLFNLQENLDFKNPCVYTVLATVIPPGDTYKPQLERTMFGAHNFTEIDFEKSYRSS